MYHKNKILALKDGECYLWPGGTGEEGLAKICYKEEFYFIWKMPERGGELTYVAAYSRDQLDKLIALVEKWNDESLSNMRGSDR